MKVTFTGVPGEKHESVHMYGQDFPLNKAVEVTNPTAMRKLANHPHFKAEATAEDMKLDEQVRRDVMAAATRGLADAQKDAMQRPHGATALAPAPTPTPAEPNLRPMRSATEYVERVEQGGGAGLVEPSTEELREQLAEREAQEQESKGKTPRKEASDGNAGRTGNQDPSKDEGGRAAPNTERGRAGKGS